MKDHTKCKYSTGIDGSITAGTGKLDDLGFWEFPCNECAWKARAEEAKQQLLRLRQKIRRIFEEEVKYE